MNMTLNVVFGCGVLSRPLLLRPTPLLRCRNLRPSFRRHSLPNLPCPFVLWAIPIGIRGTQRGQLFADFSQGGNLRVEGGDDGGDVHSLNIALFLIKFCHDSVTVSLGIRTLVAYQIESLVVLLEHHVSNPSRTVTGHFDASEASRSNSAAEFSVPLTLSADA